MGKGTFDLRQPPGGSKYDTSHITVETKKGWDNANWISRLWFFWLDPLFWKGLVKKDPLDQSDLHTAPRYTDSQTIQDRFQRFWTEELARRHRGLKPRLQVVILKMLAIRMFFHFFLTLILIGLKVFQALLVGWLAQFFTSEQTPEDIRDAYLYATGMLLVGLVMPLFHAHAFLIGQEMGMISRIALTGAIYRKTLELSLKTIGETSIGKIVNLASNDVQRMDIAFMFSTYFIISPLHLLTVGVLLWTYVGLGASCLPGLGLLVLQIPFQLFLGHIYAKFRHASARKTDRRVKIMNEIILGIRVIKMYGWEYAFKNLITKIRRSESILITIAAMARAITSAFLFASPGIVALLIFSTYALTTGDPLSPAIVFTTVSLIINVRISAIMLMLRAILGLQEANVACKRIQDLLLKDLPDPSKKRRYSRRPTITSLRGDDLTGNGHIGEFIHKVDHVPEGETPSIRVENLTANWGSVEESERTTVSNISFTCGVNNRMLAIVGPVGAGKSSILSCLLGELEPQLGDIEIVGTLGYAAQEPWVFSGTIRDNILFGQPFDEHWYQEVLEACCLKEDVAELPHGDTSIVGERGVTLSGGQKARVTLARAIYRKADVYILDDPLSAVDTVVGRRLVQTCMSGVLKNSIVVLVTHHLQYAQLADSMLVIDQGEPLAYGTYDQIMEKMEQSDEDVRYGRMKAVLREMIESMHHQEDRNVFNVDSQEDLDCVIEEEDISCPPLSPRSGDEVTLIEIQSRGRRPTHDFTRDGSVVQTEPLMDPGGTLNVATSIATFPSMWDIADHEFPESKEIEEKEEEMTKKVYTANVVPMEDKAQGHVSLKTYVMYFRSGAGYIGALLLALAFVLAEVNIDISDWWLSEWAESNTTCQLENSTNILCDFSTETILGIYSGIVGNLVILSGIRSIALYYVCTRASKIIHNNMFGAILRVPVRFFDLNPVGRVLNRFSKDLAFLDDLLPFYFGDFLAILLKFFSIMIFAGVANPYVFIPVVVVMGSFLFLRWYYLKTGRDVKRLEAVSRSPLYSHISASLQGLTTIRACERQDAFVAYFHAYQNEQSKGWSGFLMTSRWFGIRIDSISAIFVGIVAFSAVPLAGQIDIGLIGLALTYSISLAGMFQYGVRMSTEVENLMISAERLMAYGKLEPEAPLETPPGVPKPPRDWPSCGSVRVQGMKYRYSPDNPYVLKGITFNIKPQEKVGIVGRTGAGKSSLVQALFRMAEPEGLLEIDGVSITELGLHDLRQKISIIPQDPVLFSGSVRYNLDPFGQHTDEEIWRALEQVQLKGAIEEMSSHLEASVSESGSNFSVGQRQLMCLGRALLRRNKILVIDEATANVDMTTDAIIQQTIRREFSDCTTLTIAHRLNTIMDSDRIMVLSYGYVKEFDSPHVLLLKPQSLLSRMVRQTGPSESDRLRRIAEEKYFQGNNQRKYSIETAL